MKNKVITLLIEHQKSLTIISIICLIAMSVFMKPIKINGEIKGFNVENLDQYKNGIEISENFGSAKFIQVNIVARATKAINVLNSLDKLEEKLISNIKNIRIQSLNHANKLLKIGDSSNESIQSVLLRAKQLPLVEELISKDNLSFLFIVFVDSVDNFNLELFNSILNKEDPNFEKTNALSSFHVGNEIAQSIKRDGIVLSILIIAFFTLFLIFVYKDFSILIYLLLIIGLSICPVFYFYSIFDIPLNIITVLAIPVVLVLVVEDAIHILTGYLAAEHIESHNEKLKQVLSNYLVPSINTSLTTAVAFFSFLFNDAPNIQNFGLITGLAILTALIFTFGVGLFSLRFIKKRTIKSKEISYISKHLDKYKFRYSIGLVVLFIVSFFFLPSLKFDTNMDTFIPRGTKLYEDQKIINEQYYSIYRMEVMISKKNKESSTYELRKIACELHSKLESLSEIGKVNSIKDQIDYKNKYQGFSALIRFPSKFNPYHTQTNEAVRLDVRLLHSKDLMKVKKKIENNLKKYHLEYDVKIFSYGLLINELNNRSAKSLLSSLLFSGLLITILIYLMTKSVVYTLISIGVNLIPLSFVILIYYFFNLDLNLLTAMIAVVSIGLIVNDTIHVVYRRVVLKSELLEISFGLIVTSVILIGGFFMFVFSIFNPSQTFGVVCAVVFLINVICDLTLLPYLLDKVLKK